MRVLNKVYQAHFIVNNSKTQKVVVIGAGFAGLSAATCLAKEGYNVTLLEKNDCPGGRARKFEVDGYTFDMGPSWYWMPDVFENYFALFGKKVSDYYTLDRLDPGYRIYFGEGEERRMDVPAKLEDIYAMFERYEPGSSANLKKFLEEAKYKYEVGINEFVHKPGLSVMEFAEWRVVKSVFRLQMLTSMAKHVEDLFQNQYLRELLKFPVLFLGATPENTPAMYSLMNYADLVGGTWFPRGGMFKIVEGMVKLAEEQGVTIKLSHTVTGIESKNGKATKVRTDKGDFEADIVVGGADYHHLDQAVLTQDQRNYTPEYWDKRVMAPSSLLFYMGVNKKLANLEHHNLFFDEDFKVHAEEIYTNPKWPSKPLFYVCVTTKTDLTQAPEGCENVFILIPTAHSLEDTEEIREKYYHMVMERLERITGQEIRSHVTYKRSYAHRDFISDYNAFKGNAYGLANTLMQTAILKPTLKSKKMSNFYFTGQLTVPGPGVPPSLISGQVVAKEIVKHFG